MTTHTYDVDLLTGPRRDQGAPGLVAALTRRLSRWSELARQRQQLAALDDDLLRDVGVSREEALREAGRRFWDDPLLHLPSPK